VLDEPDSSVVVVTETGCDLRVCVRYPSAPSHPARLGGLLVSGPGGHFIPRG
jgi:hypothetical protein